MRYAAPFNYDAWKLAAPEDTDRGRTCGDCLFCKGVGRILACVADVFEATNEDVLLEAEVFAVEHDQEACDRWEDLEG